MKTLELSYSHLPDYLKPCLLYFAAFQEDEVIDVRKLLWLWISEGFVQQTEEKSLEEAAYNYLMGLINRSLILVTKKGVMNVAKTCRLHDLVHGFCVKKAKEESFLHIIHSWKDPFCLAGPSNPHRICVHNTKELKIWEIMLIFPNLRCLLLFGHQEEDWGILLPKLLRVLDLGGFIIEKSFPMEVVLLVHLRYLVLSRVRSIPSAIDNLSRLKVLVVQKPLSDVELPETIWNINTLSYLNIEKLVAFLDNGFSFPDGNLEVSPDLDHLETLDLEIVTEKDACKRHLQKILKKLPSIRRLKCLRPYRLRAGPRNCDNILVFDCLNHLQSLRLTYFEGYGFKFPLNLKKLTLENNRQPWSEISTIGKLPHLEVLKLLASFVGEEWVMKEGEFPNLRVLQLLGLDIRRWTASSGNFSRLEKLGMRRVFNLEEVPSCLGECPTLEMIEVVDCSVFVANSVNQIRQEQMDGGNEVLKIVIEHCLKEESSSRRSRRGFRRSRGYFRRNRVFSTLDSDEAFMSHFDSGESE